MQTRSTTVQSVEARFDSLCSVFVDAGQHTIPLIHSPLVLPEAHEPKFVNAATLAALL